jgi:hypothetical protein
MIPTKHIALAQRLLNEHVGAGLAAQGNWQSKSNAAAYRFVGHLPTRGVMTRERWVALTIQQGAWLSGNKIARDGRYGPNTRDASYRLMGEMYVRPDEAKIAIPSPQAIKAVRCWTPTDAQMIRHYGQPGSGTTVAHLPFPMRLDWDLTTSVTRTSVHVKAKDSLLGALELIRDHYGLEELRRLNIDRFGGVLNVRKKRGGTTWSAHAWGTAIDLWPDANRLAWKRDRAAFARPEYAGLLGAFRQAGWLHLGTCYDFDWMHWQLNPS